MAAQLPAKLKAAADITRFAQRAAQLESVKPAITYWCEYWIVNQLLARGLHNTDAECLQYTAGLMDKLEETKTKYANDDAIIDDTAGQAYVEQFSLETFDRADRAVQANKVTKQTADTFLAASTFFELLNIWGEPDQEIQAKLRYAKWNAVRIIKAIKEGKDPNESNPVSEPEPETAQDQPPLDPNDPEVQQFSPAFPPPPTAHEVPDDQDSISPHLATQPHLDTSHFHQSPPPFAPQHPPSQDISPIETHPSASPRARTPSIGGGYFPSVPTGTRTTPPPTIPTHLPPAPSPTTSTASPTHDLPTFPPALPTAPTSLPAPNPHQAAYDTPAVSTLAAPVPLPLPAHPAPAPAAHDPAAVLDDVAIAKAQKHARWAISALNFEDADTAIRELRAALETLGAK